MDKLEPRLQRLIEERSLRAPLYNLTTEAIDASPIDVTITCMEKVPVPWVDVSRPQDQRAALADVTKNAKKVANGIVQRLKTLGVRSTGGLPLANAVSASLTLGQLREIVGLDEVELIRWDIEEDVACMTESVRLIEAAEVWRDENVEGNGVKVAVLDSGVDKNHPALTPSVISQFTMTPGPAGTPGSHGTHVAGTIASRDPVYKGVAPGAQIIDIQVLTPAGSGQPQWVIRGLEKAVEEGARVANLSLGWSEIYHNWLCNDGDCILCVAADNAMRLGLLVVVAAGNEGNAAAGYPGKFNIRHPGAAREVLTVAAVDKQKKLAPFSSVGPGSARAAPGSTNRLTKPDVAAPGVGIMSTIPGGGFAAFNGTSMASPHVAGVAALAAERHPAMRAPGLKKLIEHTTEPLPNPQAEVGYGMVNAYSAVTHR